MLIAATQDKDDNARLAAILALGKARDSSVFSHLVGILHNGSTLECEAAARALGDMKDAQAVPYLSVLFNDKRHLLALNARDSVKKITGRPPTRV